MIRVLIFKQQNCAPCKTLVDDLIANPLWNNECHFEWFDMTNPSDLTVDMSVKYNVRAAPTVVILKDDKPYYSGTMVKTAEQLKKLIEEAK